MLNMIMICSHEVEGEINKARDIAGKTRAFKLNDKKQNLSLRTTNDVAVFDKKTATQHRTYWARQRGSEEL